MTQYNVLRRTELCSRGRVTLEAMTHVYGDSTPFPYDVDYIDLSRLAVDCAVQLMSAQHAIATALERGESLGQERRSVVARITAMARSVESGLEPFVNTGSLSPSSGADRVAQRMLECVQSTASAELATLEHGRSRASCSGTICRAPSSACHGPPPASRATHPPSA
jgi:hypothetical protein